MQWQVIIKHPENKLISNNNIYICIFVLNILDIFRISIHFLCKFIVTFLKNERSNLGRIFLFVCIFVTQTRKFVRNGKKTLQKLAQEFLMYSRNCRICWFSFNVNKRMYESTVWVWKYAKFSKKNRAHSPTQFANWHKTLTLWLITLLHTGRGQARYIAGLNSL